MKKLKYTLNIVITNILNFIGNIVIMAIIYDKNKNNNLFLNYF